MRVIPAAIMAAALGLASWSAAQEASASSSVHDVGIFSDLDGAVRITLPGRVDAAQTRVRLDEVHRTVVLYEGDFPLKVYALAGSPPREPTSAPSVVALLAAADAAEVGPLVSSRTAVDRVSATHGVIPKDGDSDSDGDGIPDRPHARPRHQR